MNARTPVKALRPADSAIAGARNRTRLPTDSEALGAAMDLLDDAAEAPEPAEQKAAHEDSRSDDEEYRRRQEKERLMGGIL